MRWLTRMLGLAVLIAGGPALALDVSFPIQLDHAFLRQLLIRQFYTGKNQTSLVWRDTNGCTEMVLSKPVISGAHGSLSLTSAFDAKLGAGVGKFCIGASPWKGLIELVLQPSLNGVLPVVEFRVIDSHVYGVDGQKQFTGAMWDYVKAQVHPHFEAFVVDLRRPIAELKLVLPLFLPREDVKRTQRLLESISLSQISATDDGLSAIVHLDVPAAALVSGAQPEPTLTIEEVRRWEAAWQSWDGFLTFIIKRAGREAVDPAVMTQLQDVLLEARYDLLPALRPTSPNQPDPVRPLFIRTWKRLAPVLRELSVGVPGESGVRYLSFVTAADALAALDQLGPEFGFEISSDGLRRLARTIDPASLDDPTRYSEDVDPELRKMFGFGKPIPVPEMPTPPDGILEEGLPEDTPVEDMASGEPSASAAISPMTEATATTSPDAPATSTAAPAADTEPPAAATPHPTATPPSAELAAPTATPIDTATVAPPSPSIVIPATETPAEVEDEYLDATPSLGPQSGWRFPSVSDWFVSPAWAAADVIDTKRFYRWVPERTEVIDYLKLVRTVLAQARDETQTKAALPAEFREVFSNLVFATAWQETCWRQFIKSRGSIRTIASPVGAVGIMQVNSKVWRGFYNVDALKADLAYNARAGTEIVRHYFVDYAIKKGEHKVTGDLHALAHATYSAYNAGPARLTRYRKPAGKQKGSIDLMFAAKYKEVRAGKELGVASCYGITPPA